jgi:histidyl-tRNA synthetase
MLQPTTRELYKNAMTLAHLYGFSPFSELSNIRVKNTENRDRSAYPKISASERKSDGGGGEIIRTLELCHQKGLLSENTPRRFWISNVDTGQRRTERPKHIVLGLYVVGVQQTIAEAIILKTAHTILSETTKENLHVKIHTIGDKDSSARFLRELSIFFRKHIAEFSPQAQALIKTDPWSAYTHIHNHNHPLTTECPTPMESLNTQSRKHFEEVLEYLEATGVPYEIDQRLIGNRENNTNTLFSIEAVEGQSDEKLPCSIYGGRYDELVRRIFKTPVGVVGVTLASDSTNTMPRPTKIEKKPIRIFFIHIGFDAGLKSLAVLDELRRVKIPFHHELGKVPLSEHLQNAEELGAPYLLLLGQKEAMEQSIILRNMNTRAQESIPMQNLGARLRVLRR